MEPRTNKRPTSIGDLCEWCDSELDPDGFCDNCDDLGEWDSWGRDDLDGDGTTENDD